MVKRLIWSKDARNSRRKILEYWKERNKSVVYSKKLNELFKKSAKQIKDFPYSGIRMENGNYRGKLIKDYYLLYSIKSEHIEILLIWDSRQDPLELQNILDL